MPAIESTISDQGLPIPRGHQSVVVTSTASTLAALLTAAGGAISAVPSGTQMVYLQPRADGIRYAHGGSTPNTVAGAGSVGTDLFAGAQYPIRFADLGNLKLVAAANTVLSIEFRG